MASGMQVRRRDEAPATDASTKRLFRAINNQRDGRRGIVELSEDKRCVTVFAFFT